MKFIFPLTALILVSTNAIAKPAPQSEPLLAIHEIEDRSANHYKSGCAFVGVWATPGEAIREILTSELLKIGGLEIVEREKIDEIFQDEFERKNLAGTSEKNAFSRANFVIAGVVSEFESCTTGEDLNVDIGSLLGIGEMAVGNKSSVAHVTIELRLIEVKTGKILKTFRSSGQIKDDSVAVAVGILGNRFSREAFEKMPLGKATQIAVTDAAQQIASALKK